MRVCLYGLGSIGSATARALLADPDVRITGAIDVDPRKTGRDLHSLLRMRGSSGVEVTADPAATLASGSHDIVIHSTGSRLKQIVAQLEQILAAGFPCVTSCEEMAFPEAAAPSLARRLDRAARAKGVALLGAGVNPGFVMDALVLALSGATREVEHIAVERVLDPLSRRRVFQKKVGIGMTWKEANRLVSDGSMGHVGLRESAHLVARGMGWNITSVDEDVRVLCADEAPKARSRRASDPDAPVTGLRQTLIARSGRTERLKMEMLMQAGVEGAHDAITINGHPGLNLWIQGGIPGDEATVSCLINAARHAVAPPRAGLLTVLDLPLRPSHFRSSGSSRSPADATAAG